jgi:general secretion pathway protein N
MELKETSSKGQVNVDLINLKSALSTISPLGDYRITIDLSPISTFQVRTLKGVLEIKGQGQIRSNGIEFKGEAKALPENKESLIGLLSVLGKNQGDTTLLQF